MYRALVLLLLISTQVASAQNSKFGAHSLATGIQLSKWGDECVGRGTNASATLLFRKAAAILERYPGKATSELADCYRGFAYNDQDNKRWFSAETNKCNHCLTVACCL